MNIRTATLNDIDGIKQVYHDSFNPSEAEVIGDLAIELLNETPEEAIHSLLAEENNEIIAHVSFSPVYSVSNNQHLGHILSPLAVSAFSQKKGIGTSLVKQGIDLCSSSNSKVIFVYGDPNYYSRFGFEVEPAQKFQAPYALTYPSGWQALILNKDNLPEQDSIHCVTSLQKESLW